MVHAVTTDLCAQFRLLFGGLDPDSIVLPDPIVDQVNLDEPGYFFGTESSNAQRWDPQPEALLQHFIISGRFHAILGDTIVFKPQACSEWLNQCRLFHKLLLLAIFLVQGQPSRGTELVIASFANSYSRTRSLLLINRMLIVYLAYCKTTNVTGDDNKAIRALDPILTRIVLLTTLYIKPVEIFLASEYLQLAPPSVAECQQYLFYSHGKFFDTNTLTTIMQTYTQTHLGWPFGVHDMRHIIISIARKVIRENHLVLRTTSAYLDYQAAHSPDTADRIYGRTDNITVSDCLFQVYVALSSAWHEVRIRSTSFVHNNQPLFISSYSSCRPLPRHFLSRRPKPSSLNYKQPLSPRMP